MPTRRSLVAAAVTIVSVALLAAGCGGSKSSSGGTTTTGATSTETWANNLCLAITTYKTSLGNVVTSVTASPSATGIKNGATQAETATTTFISTVKGLGKPNTSSGQQAQDYVLLESHDQARRRPDHDQERGRGALRCRRPPLGGLGGRQHDAGQRPEPDHRYLPAGGPPDGRAPAGAPDPTGLRHALEGLTGPTAETRGRGARAPRRRSGKPLRRTRSLPPLDPGQSVA